jgi:hypothetical protein
LEQTRNESDGNHECLLTDGDANWTQLYMQQTGRFEKKEEEEAMFVFIYPSRFDKKKMSWKTSFEFLHTGIIKLYHKNNFLCETYQYLYVPDCFLNCMKCHQL